MPSATERSSVSLLVSPSSRANSYNRILAANCGYASLVVVLYLELPSRERPFSVAVLPMRLLLSNSAAVAMRSKGAPEIFGWFITPGNRPGQRDFLHTFTTGQHGLQRCLGAGCDVGSQGSTDG